MIRDCEIRHLVSEPSKRRAVEELLVGDTTVECVIGMQGGDGLAATGVPWDEVFALTGEQAPDLRILEDDLAYIIYTSGSTGTPKGIMHAHRSGLAFARLSARTYDVRPGDRLSNHPPLHSDMSTFDFFAGPLGGATTVIIPEEHTKLPASLSKLIQDERLTIWYSVASALVQLSTRGVLDARDLSSLRWVMFCGEPMPAKNLRMLMEALPGARFSNVYGPAEVNQCTYYHVPHPPRDDAESIPIGREWDNTEGLILDERDEPVPEGAVGELVIRSATMMRGYWNRPDLDERAFYRRAALPGYDEVFYRCGDLVRRQPDGELQFIGRVDRQIKTRGHRVELDEVEAALTAHDVVDEAAAFAVPDPEIGKRVEAAILPRAGAALSLAVLQKHLRERLPIYAVPSAIRILDSLPRTPTGKIDRRALQESAVAASVDRDRNKSHQEE